MEYLGQKLVSPKSLLEKNNQGNKPSFLFGWVSLEFITLNVQQVMLWGILNTEKGFIKDIKKKKLAIWWVRVYIGLRITTDS